MSAENQKAASGESKAFINASGYLIKLIASELEGKKAPKKPDEIKWEQVFSIAKFHSVDNLAFYAAERLEAPPEGELFKQWRKSRDMEAVKSINQLAERDIIYRALTENKIRFIPLKGCILKEMYPQDDFRTMSDLDFLIDPCNAEKAAHMLESIGYEFENEREYHASFFKLPFMSVEMHTSLLPKRMGKECIQYYSDPWSRAAEISPYHYELSLEDNYIFMIVHFAKHYFMGGSGIRSVMDIHVFLQKHGSELDRKYIEAELKKISLNKFAKTAENLAGHWFSGNTSDPETEEMALYVLTSGTYGIKQHSVHNQIENIRKKNPHFVRTRYFLKRIFQPYSKMKLFYPFLKKYPFLLPFCEVHRWIKALIFKKETIHQQIDTALKEK